MQNIKKIVVIGPESTGKSTLCNALAQHFNSQWVEEYARSFLLNNGNRYDYDDLLTIAKGQVALEKKALSDLENSAVLSTNRSYPLFIDTDMYVMKVWCEFVFNQCHSWILNQIVASKYDLYLLCNTDLPWVKDELREYPDLTTREKLFHYYQEILTNQSTPWVSITGINEARVEKAIAAVNAILDK